MSRTLLLVVLAISAVACSNKEEAAPAQQQPATGDTAGKVLEVAGKATVKGKQLAVGDLLKAEDQVETGDDGRVVIELTHNLAHWELGPNKSQKVSESIAWKLPRDEGNAKVVIQDMSAAGRPAERSAADTAASAPAPSLNQDKGAAPPPATAAAPKAEPPPPPAQPAPGGGAAKGASRAPEKTAAPPPPPAEAVATERGGAPPKPGASAESMIEAKEPALRACLGKGALVKIHVDVDASGKATTTIDGAADAKVAACLKGVIGKLALPAAKASVSMQIENSNR
jgi:hypothetical protein